MNQEVVMTSTKKVVIFYPDSLPKGRLYIENMTPVSALCAVRSLDRSRYDLKVITRFINGDDYVDQILNHCKNAIVFGVSTFIGYQIKEGIRASKEVKRRYPDLPIIWGGWFPSSAPELTLNNDFVDMVALGQGELTMAELVDALEKGSSLEGIASLWFKNRTGGIVRNKPRPFVDLNDLPPIPYDLLEGANLIYNMDGYRTIDYMTSYGCPHRCTFCCEPAVNKRRWSGLSPERIIADLEYLQEKFNVEAVTLLDTNTFTNANRIREFCKLYLQKGLKIRFTMTCGKISHLVKFDDELWELIGKANMSRIQVGLESGTQEYLGLLQKDNKAEDVLVVLNKAKQFNIKLFISTMIGIPTADMKIELNANIDLINNVLEVNDSNKFSMYLYTPLPATALLPLAEKEGFVQPKTLEEWSNYDFNQKFVPWIKPYYVNLLLRLQFYFKYILVKDLIYSIPSPVLRAVYWVVYWIFNPIARFRFRRKYFGLPLDYYFLKFCIRSGQKVQVFLDSLSKRLSNASQSRKFKEKIGMKINVQDKESEKDFFSAVYSSYSSELNPDDMIVIEHICGIFPNGKGRILEAGCGMSHFGRKLVAKGFECIAVDLSAVAVKKVADEKRHLKKYKILEGDIEDIDLFEKHFFDLILAPTILHHFPDLSTSNVIHNFSHWVSENGFCVIYEPNGTNVINKISVLLGSIFSLFLKVPVRTHNEKNHSFYDYIDAFSRCGFVLEKGIALTPAEPMKSKSATPYILRFLIFLRYCLYRLTNRVFPFPYGGGILLLIFRKAKQETDSELKRWLQHDRKK